MSIIHHKPHITSTVVILVAVVVLGIGTFASTHKWPPFKTAVQEIAPYITNNTKAVRIISIKKVGEGVTSDIEVTLQNWSDKRILAYAFAYGESGMTTSSISFLPGQTMVERIPLANVESAARNNPSQSPALRLSAVYLEGGVSEGEPEEVARLSSRMLGTKEQAKLAIQILRQALDSSEADPEAAMRAVEFQVSSLPTKADHFDRPSYAQAGKSSINSGVISRLKELRKLSRISSFDRRQALADVIRTYEQLVAEL
jgi:hypothetical protein